MKPLIALTFLLAASLTPASAERKIACKTPSNAASCYWTHGRLGFYNGTPRSVSGKSVRSEPPPFPSRSILTSYLLVHKFPSSDFDFERNYK
jgi:hypothetical protein